jgi:hypothetical protein
MATLRRSSLVAVAVWCWVGMRDSRSFGVWDVSPERSDGSSVLTIPRHEERGFRARAQGFLFILPLDMELVVPVNSPTGPVGWPDLRYLSITTVASLTPACRAISRIG